MFYVISVMIVAIACNNNGIQGAPGGAETTDLNAIITELPNAPGYDVFKTNCTSCHSARYVQMQPAFPEKTWTAIVTKMQKNFGAPVSDSSAKEIVKYLVAIKGKT
ncbi:MAG TPA: cytochrome c [Parafilimonas sp.]|nr:cytochrome c [Parafilimonas sp.]